jgi:hypothetical protein
MTSRQAPDERPVEHLLASVPDRLRPVWEEDQRLAERWAIALMNAGVTGVDTFRLGLTRSRWCGLQASPRGAPSRYFGLGKSHGRTAIRARGQRLFDAEWVISVLTDSGRERLRIMLDGEPCSGYRGRSDGPTLRLSPSPDRSTTTTSRTARGCTS